MTSSNRQFLYATVVKHVDKAIYDVIALALSGRQYLDILDAERGIYGHRYNVSDGGITFKTYLPALTSANSRINGAAAQASKIAA